MSETVESAQSMLQQINDASSRYGMDISKEKTKSMLVADKQRVLGIKLANSDIEQVSQFKESRTKRPPFITANTNKLRKTESLIFCIFIIYFIFILIFIYIYLFLYFFIFIFIYIYILLYYYYIYYYYY